MGLYERLLQEAADLPEDPNRERNERMSAYLRNLRGARPRGRWLRHQRGVGTGAGEVPHRHPKAACPPRQPTQWHGRRVLAGAPQEEIPHRVCPPEGHRGLLV